MTESTTNKCPSCGVFDYEVQSAAPDLQRRRCRTCNFQWDQPVRKDERKCPKCSSTAVRLSPVAGADPHWDCRSCFHAWEDVDGLAVESPDMYLCPKCGKKDSTKGGVRPHPLEGLPRLYCPDCAHVWDAVDGVAEGVAVMNHEERQKSLQRATKDFGKQVDKIDDAERQGREWMQPGVIAQRELDAKKETRTCPRCQHDNVASLWGSGYGGGREYVCNRCRTHWTERDTVNVNAAREAAVLKLARRIYTRDVTQYPNTDQYGTQSDRVIALRAILAAEEFYKCVEAYGTADELEDPK